MSSRATHVTQVTSLIPAIWVQFYDMPLYLWGSWSLQGFKQPPQRQGQWHQQPSQAYSLRKSFPPPRTFTHLISPRAHAHCSLHSHGTWCYITSQAEHTHSRIWAACQNCPIWKSPPLKYKPLAQEPRQITCWLPKCRGRDLTQVTNPMQSLEQELRNQRHDVLNCTPSGRDAEPSQVPLPGGSAALVSWLTSLVSQSSFWKENKCWTLLSVVCLCCQTIKVCFWVFWIWGSFSPIDNCSKYQNSKALLSFH